MHDFIRKNAKALLYIAAFLTAGILYVINAVVLPRDAVHSFEDGESYAQSSESSSYGTGKEQASSEAAVYVYVCGAVVRPGVYTLSPGDRVVNAIEAAGGATQQAYIVNLNLAGTVSDGMRIYVPDSSGALDSGDPAAEQNLVNINTATRAELMTLPGIGQSRADDIIAYRKSNGGFRQIDDIMQVPGIKEGAFSKIKDYITVS